MKRLITLVFFISFTLTCTSFGELLKLPMLAHHYIEHIHDEKQLTFAEFMAEHYEEQILHPNGKHQDHEKLPFKSLDHCDVHLVTISPEMGLSVSKPSSFLFVQEKINYISINYSNSYLDRIWQPPRFC